MGVVPGRALSGPGVTVLRTAKVGGSESDDHLLRVRSLDGTGGNRSASRVRAADAPRSSGRGPRSEEHTSELQSRPHLVCRLLLEKKKKTEKILSIKKKKKKKKTI